MNKKTGFIHLIGRPSSGKSTLINQICGFKISIVSPSPQTTRFFVRGIYNDDDSQMIFVDTPGYHNFNSFLNQGLSKMSVNTLMDSDLILYLVDLTREFGEEEQEIINHIKKFSEKSIIVFNKTDLENKINKETKEIVKTLLPDNKYIDISAKDNSNIDTLLQTLKDNLNEGPMYYPEEYVTDQSIPFRITEIIREKVIECTREEIPHSVYIKVIDLKVDKKITAHATIYVDRKSQKGIIIGNKGETIKQIGISARKELKQIFEKNIDLFLHVKIHNNWKKDEDFIKNMFQID